VRTCKKSATMKRKGTLRDLRGVPGLSSAGMVRAGQAHDAHKVYDLLSRAQDLHKKHAGCSFPSASFSDAAV
jgi:hypothetical protein